MSPATSGRRGAALLLALAVGVVGAVLIVWAVRAQQSAPEPPASVGTLDTPSASATPTKPSSRPSARAAPLPASRPVSITIPAIKVDSSVFPIGLADDGTLAVPQPGPRLDHAAWFENSPTPGQPGPSIIEGHVDSPQGPSVFFRLGDLRPGHRIIVTRADGIKVEFTVNAVRDFKKKEFPTDLVYGGDDLSRPTLRLITCSDFDPSIRHHVGNEVVFAHLTRTIRPST